MLLTHMHITGLWPSFVYGCTVWTGWYTESSTSSWCTTGYWGWCEHVLLILRNSFIRVNNCSSKKHYHSFVAQIAGINVSHLHRLLFLSEEYNEKLLCSNLLHIIICTFLLNLYFTGWSHTTLLGCKRWTAWYTKSVISSRCTSWC